MVDFINIQLHKEDILYDDKVKTHYNSNGIIRLKNDIGKAYVIFPIYRKDNDEDVVMAIDEVLSKEVELERDNTYKISLGQEYVGRKCVVIGVGQPIYVKLMKRDIIYDGKVKSTYNGQGLVRLKNGYLGKRAYVIFPNGFKEIDNNIFVGIDEIHNKGIHSNNDHTCRVLLNRDYIGEDCFIILQEG